MLLALHVGLRAEKSILASSHESSANKLVGIATHQKNGKLLHSNANAFVRINQRGLECLETVTTTVRNPLSLNDDMTVPVASEVT